MYNRNDPRFRRRLDQLSQNLESAQESAQEGLFSFSENYIKPCFNSITTFVEPCTKECFPDPRERARRNPRARGRGRLEHSFDFYDDWETDETDALLALEGDEFDRVVGGYGTQEPAQQQPQSPQQQPARRRSYMNYGQRAGHTRRKSATAAYDADADPTVIPNQSYFGFLTRLPFKIGRGRLRYKPSAADLQERTTRRGKTPAGDEIDTLAEEDGEDDTAEQSHDPALRTAGRRRSGTTASGHTTDSFSSRGDIFPSDDEDDAIPLDDEFTVALERRTTNSNSNSGSAPPPSTDDTSSAGAKRKKKQKKPPTPSDASSDAGGTRPPSSSHSARGRPSRIRKSTSSTPRSAQSVSSDPEMGELPSISALKHEDEQARKDEAAAVEKSREQAQQLAIERKLAGPTAIAPADDNKAERDAELQLEEEQDAATEASTADPAASVSVADGPIEMEDNEAADGHDHDHEAHLSSPG